MAYGFDQGLMSLCDLRVYLSTVLAKAGKAHLQDNLLNDPTLSTNVRNKHTILQTRPELMAARKAFLSRAAATHTAVTYQGMPVHLGGMYQNSTCLLVGCGPSFNEAFVKQAHADGCVVITIGNACALYPDADYWIGVRQPSAYVNQAFQSPRTICLYPVQHATLPLWNTRDGVAVDHVRVFQQPAMLFGTFEAKTLEDFVDSPSVTTFGLDTSLTAGLSAAACMGFTNIVLHGVSGMVAPGTPQYAFPETMHETTLRRKLHTYAQLSDSLMPLLMDLFDSLYVRIWTDDGCPLPCRKLPAFELGQVLGMVGKRFKVESSLSGISQPVALREEQARLSRAARAAMLNVVMVADKLPELAKLWPESDQVGKKAVLEADTKLQAALAKTGSCSNCEKSSTCNSIFQMFMANVAAEKGDATKPFHMIWLELFPENLAALHRATPIKHPAYKETT